MRHFNENVAIVAHGAGAAGYMAAGGRSMLDCCALKGQEELDDFSSLARKIEQDSGLHTASGVQTTESGVLT